MRISGIVKDSIVDGPGLRLVIFFQGCKHNCKGCHNPDTHDPQGGYEESIIKVLDMIKEDPLIEGVTLSGGDPLEQPVSCYNLCRNEDWDNILQYIDVLVDGPFVEFFEQQDLHFRGSSNQRLIDVKASRDEEHVILYQSNYSNLDKFRIPE